MKRILLIIGTLLVIFALVTCGSQDPKKGISRELSVDVSHGKIAAYLDTHGGFHGDGTTFIALEFSGDKILEQVQGNGQWKPFPLDDTVKALIYGLSDESGRIGPYICDEERNPLFPDIQDGYYLLIDHHPEAGKDGKGILDRFSFNFTLAILDTDANTLYFYKFDT